MDLNNPNQVYTINSSTSPAIGNFIEQIEIRNDGKIWLRQTDYSTGQNSIAYYDGSSWSGFHSGNAPFGSRVTGLSISPSGSAYILASGNDTQVYKFNRGSWEKAGAALPFKDFGGDLWIDKNESFWIANRYGLSILASEAALPVTVRDFMASAESNLVTLKWKVADQIEMSKYVVEHSTDAKTFRAISETPAIDTTFYSLTHYNPAAGLNYYRLKSIEIDADFAYSKIIAVDLSSMEEMFFYPNPASHELEIKVGSNLINQPGTMTIFTADGKRILSKEIGKLKKRENIDVSSLSSGTYLIRIENNLTVGSGMIQVVR
ncbi:T9SS type A sorting domain-containing protein [Dyadobacter sp. CY261]|uniref:T9SS type A sorting domain-containing protein n=1 Tax=Dyadobacter sp. CY261 TaxID=2907203 RepID=UPI001F3B7B3C|nr:T9SS type A sorting domain-containing protein [Dyadobacter sp. CY261]MCF0068829.1 T9SS type A sorting domain-containing protein [Dyadobacter sp. CY261]